MGNKTGVPDIQDSASVPVCGSAFIVGSGIKANAAAVATSPAQPGATTYVTGLAATASGATAGATVTLALAGVAGGPINFAFTFPAGAGVQAYPLEVNFNPAIPAAAVNSAITLTLPAGGAGNGAAAVMLTGFTL